MKQTALTLWHKDNGAKMTEYAGWAMPLQYGNVLSEHRTVRSHIGIFDLSHMGELVLSGEDAVATLAFVTANDPRPLQVGQVQYNLLLNEKGGIVDDILIYRLPDSFYLVVNAANVAKDFSWINQHLQGDTQLTDVSSTTAMIAIQGPQAPLLAEKVFGSEPLLLPSFRFQDQNYHRVPVRISRTGYTGEDGFEFYLPSDAALDLWQDLLVQGDELGITPVGLAARDTLRLEARLPLYGNELNDETTPWEAGLHRFVCMERPPFLGQEALRSQFDTGVQRRLVAFVADSRGIPRKGYAIVDGDQEIGSVTSGTMSPMLETGIGLGYVSIRYAQPGTKIAILVRKTKLDAHVIKGRFTTHITRRPTHE